MKGILYRQGLEKAEPYKYDMDLEQSVFDVLSNSNVFVRNQFHFL